jgi:AcrR family transcriptional regulator
MPPRISQDFLDQVRRQQIIEAAGRVIARKGVLPTSVTEITREGKVSRETFYRLFKGKNQCLEALVEWVGTEAARQVSEAVANVDHEDRLQAGVDALLSFAAQHPGPAKAFLDWGPAISPKAQRKTRQRFAVILSPSPGPREEMLVGAVEQSLYRHFAGAAGVSPMLLFDLLVELVRSSEVAPSATGTVHAFPTSEPERAAA